MVEIHQLAAAVYLAAGIGALVGVVLPAPGMGRGATWGLAIGALVQTLAFATLHRVESPPITSLPVVLASSAWMTVLFALLLTWKVRLPGLAAVVGPLAFLSVFVASLGWKIGGDPSAEEAGTWPHVHVLLASGGLALLGIAGLAGWVYLREHRRLKTKPPVAQRIPLPSLEALDRVNVVTTAVGFALLTLGIVTGMVWLKGTQGAAFTGTPHEVWMMISWAIYAGLVGGALRGHGKAHARPPRAHSRVSRFCCLASWGIGVLS